jgi:Tfp pilus assembly protein PilF
MRLFHTRQYVLHIYILCALTVAATAAPSHQLVKFLRRHPDNAVLTGLIKEYLAAQHYENAYAVARYLNRVQGYEGPMVYKVLGYCALKTGDRVRAREYARRTLELDPHAGIAVKILAALDERPCAENPDQEAYRAFCEDRYDASATAIQRTLARDPHDVEALLLKSRILNARMEFTESEKILAELSRSVPRDSRIFQQLGELSGDLAAVTRKSDLLRSAALFFTHALAIDPNHVPTLLSYAVFLSAIDRRDNAIELYRKAIQHRPFQGRELALDEAMILCHLGRLDQALDELRRYSRAFGHDSRSLLAEGMVQMKRGRSDEAAELLEQSFHKNPRNVLATRTIVAFLLTLNQSDRAMRMAKVARACNPKSQQLVELERQVWARIATRDTITRQDGPFICTFPARLAGRPARLIDTILAGFREAYRTVSETFGAVPGKIRLWVHFSPENSAPAYYDPASGSILVSGEYFSSAGRPGQEAPSPAGRIQSFAVHMMKHELAHLAFVRLLGPIDSKKARTSIPLWLQEGIAEWAAGKAVCAPEGDADARRLFSEGHFLDYAQMGAALSPATLEPALNQKAFLQSFLITKYMVGQRKDRHAGLQALLEFSRQLVRSGGTLEEALQSTYRLGLADFTRSWQNFIRREVVDAPHPRLISRARRESLRLGSKLPGCRLRYVLL